MRWTPARDDGDRGEARRAHEMWAEGDAAIGTMCAIPSPFVPELLLAAGFDWICIDCQHGLIGYEDMVGMLHAISTVATTLVRVPWNAPELIMRPLDVGADGVIVPMVNSASEAAAAVSAARYPPEGFRSFGPTRASLGNPAFDPAAANREVVCAVMIETLEAVEHVDEILSTPGVDAAFVGPWDLSLSATSGLEAPGQTPRDIEWITRVLESCVRHGVISGISVGTPEQGRYWRDAGYRMVAVHSDFRMLTGAAEAVMAALEP